MNIDALIEKIYATVENHRLETPGEYARWLWQNAAGTRKMGNNEYGCADAANILYTIGRLPTDPAERAACVSVLQAFQNKETGLFFEGTHHEIHCTAHCTAALELFDAKPLYPLTGLEHIADPEAIGRFLDGLDWDGNAWPQAHQGAGIYAAFILTGMASPEWQEAYFNWLTENADPEYAVSRKGAIQTGRLKTAHHLFGWFHYLFNCSFARRPFPYADKVVDTCIDLYRSNTLDDDFGKNVNFKEIDWVYALNRSSLQSGHRLGEARACLSDFAEGYIEWLSSVDTSKNEAWNDLHALFGTTCALAELQQALPGKLITSYPLRLVLDRRPFI